MGKKKKPTKSKKETIIQEAGNVFALSKYQRHPKLPTIISTFPSVPTDGGEIDGKAQKTILTLFLAWMAYQDPENKDDRRLAKTTIERACIAAHSGLGGRPSETISIAIHELSIREEIQKTYLRFKEMEREGKALQERERWARDTMREFLERCEEPGGTILSVSKFSPRWKKRTNAIRWNNRRETKKLEDDYIAALEGYSKTKTFQAARRRWEKVRPTADAQAVWTIEKGQLRIKGRQE